MKKTTQLKSLMSAILIAGSISVAPSVVQAGVDANVGVTTNYIWRGYTQNGNIPSLSAGLDYGLDNGVYVGTWAATTGSASNGTNYEVDLYGGFANTVGNLDYDLGYIYYAYPNQKKADFSEVYGSVSMAGATVGASMTVSESWDSSKTGDLYVFGSYGLDLTKEVNLTATYGIQSYAESGAKSYSHGQLSFSYKDFSLNVDKILDKGDISSVNGANDDAVFSLSYSTSFEVK